MRILLITILWLIASVAQAVPGACIITIKQEDGSLSYELEGVKTSDFSRFRHCLEALATLGQSTKEEDPPGATDEFIASIPSSELSFPVHVEGAVNLEVILQIKAILTPYGFDHYTALDPSEGRPVVVITMGPPAEDQLAWLHLKPKSAVRMKVQKRSTPESTKYTIQMLDESTNAIPKLPVGKLGVPLGTLVEIKGEIVDGSTCNCKAWQGKYLIEVSQVNDIVLKEKRLMEFELAPYPKLPYPNNHFSLYELRKGHKVKGSLKRAELDELHKGYVGKEVHLQVWEKGTYSGMPNNMPSAKALYWQDHGFGFFTWLVLLEDLAGTDVK